MKNLRHFSKHDTPTTNNLVKKFKNELFFFLSVNSVNRQQLFSGISKDQITVKIPHRISGFFQMMDPNSVMETNNPVKIGSRGGGPALTAYGKTRLYLKKSPSLGRDQKFRIIINQKEVTQKAKTSLRVLKLFAPYIPPNAYVDVHHTFDLPVGAGYGSSGAGALGIAFGLQKLLNLSFSLEKAASFAHIAEVENHTGLGTVGGQFSGGLSITLHPGFPFHMKIIPHDSNLRVVTGTFGSLSTKSILTDSNYKQMIYAVGKKAMRLMHQDFSVQNYLNVCQFFLQKTQIMSKLNLTEVSQLIEDLNARDIIGAGMNQLGRSVFAFCSQQEADTIKDVFLSYNGLKTVQILKIHPELE